jgi:hypothetical protein
MSLTNAEVIEAALRDCGVVAETQSASPEQGRIGLDRLNRMLMDWAVSGVDFGFFPQSSASDTCPIPTWAEKGVISKLAQALQLVYPSTGGSPLLYDDNENGYATILRQSALDKLQPLDMRHLGGRAGSTYNVFTDTTQ